MANRPMATPHLVITNGSMAGDLTSLVTIIQQLSMVSYAYSWAGTVPVGSISVQVSNDYALNSNGTVKNAGTWNTMTVDLAGTGVTAIPISGNTGNGFIDIVQSSAYAMRTIYTRTSGTGTIQVTLVSKVA